MLDILFSYLERRWLWVPAFAGTTNRLSNPLRLPFPQRLGVAGRDVRVFGILADGRENLPGSRAFDADGFFNDDGDTGYVVQAECARWRRALAYLVVRAGGDLCEIDCVDAAAP